VPSELPGFALSSARKTCVDEDYDNEVKRFVYKVQYLTLDVRRMLTSMMHGLHMDDFTS